jgi:hypothetical protein
VREFRVSSDTFAELRTGEAVIHTTLGPKPITVDVQRLELPDEPAPRISGPRSECEIAVHPATQLPGGTHREGADRALSTATSKRASDPTPTAAPAARRDAEPEADDGADRLGSQAHAAAPTTAEPPPTADAWARRR